MTRYGERRLVSWNHTLLHDFSGAVNGHAPRSARTSPTASSPSSSSCTTPSTTR